MGDPHSHDSSSVRGCSNTMISKICAVALARIRALTRAKNFKWILRQKNGCLKVGKAANLEIFRDLANFQLQDLGTFRKKLSQHSQSIPDIAAAPKFQTLWNGWFCFYCPRTTQTRISSSSGKAQKTWPRSCSFCRTGPQKRCFSRQKHSTGEQICEALFRDSAANMYFLEFEGST